MVVFSPSYETCVSCGFEFGFHDGEKGFTYEGYRAQWIANGCQWYGKVTIKPANWDPAQQLKNITKKS